MAAAAPRLVILVEHLNALGRVLAGAGSAQREAFPTPWLARFLARADCDGQVADSPDALRCSLFGLPEDEAPPVAALSLVANGALDRAGDDFWIRLDPVTLQADMTRVFVLNTGFDGFSDAERSDVLACMKAVLDVEEMSSFSGDGYLCVRLNEILPFEFPPLQSVLGRDMGDVLPEHPEARPWRRLVNELQVALHHCEVNRQRREDGRSEINGGWFWGAGRIPRPSADTAEKEPGFTRVYSANPVSRGLARVQGLEPRDDESILESEFSAFRGDALLDWCAVGADAGHELQRLERLFQAVYTQASRGRIRLQLHDGAGHAWSLAKKQARRFWRKPKPLHESLQLSAT